MEYNEAKRILEIGRELEEALSTTVRINHEQVMDIVVADLFAKYKSAISKKHCVENSFKKVLLYYLTIEELEILMRT